MPLSVEKQQNVTDTLNLYYRARYYDPYLGRFISEDPIRFRGGIDFYGYVLNNPVNLSDPRGHAPCNGGDCTKVAPLPSNSSACDNYGTEPYWGASERCFCKCAGDSAWSQQVRGCLACEFNNGSGKTARHARCYTAAGPAGMPVATLLKCEKRCYVGSPSGPPGNGPVGGGGGAAW